MYFDELQQPEVRKKQFDLHRREFDESDINALTADSKLLAAIDAYGRGLIDLETLKVGVFGDFNANPRDLDFLSFQRLCFAVVHRIREGLISLPPGLELEFPQFYRPRAS